ncbi:MAG: DUF4065 domain-containing protein [Planctomycetaceae bacterium]
MATARQVAGELLRLADADEELLTQMHLHKLLYYVQGLSLGLRGIPAFQDEIQAWTHGPVVRSIRTVVGPGVPIPEGMFRDEYPSDDDRDFIRAVWNRYRTYSAWALRNMSHSERPWLEARQGLRPDEQSDRPVSHASLTEFFALSPDSGFNAEHLLQAERDIADGRIVSHADLKAQLLQQQ